MYAKCSICGLERDVEFETVPDSVQGQAMRAIMDAPDMQGFSICGWCRHRTLEDNPDERAERIKWLRDKALEDAQFLERYGVKLVDHTIDDENVRLVFEAMETRPSGITEVVKGQRRVLERSLLNISKEGRGLWMWAYAEKVTAE